MSLWPELYYLLKNYFDTLTINNQNKYFDWIVSELLNYRNEKIGKRDILRLIEPVVDYLRKDILHLAKDLIDDAKSFESVYGHPPNIFRYHSPVQIFNPATEHKSILDGKNIEELIDLINNWEPTGLKVFESPNSLGHALSEQILEDPLKYIALLERFKEIKV